MRLRGWEAEKRNQSEHALTNDKGEEKKKQEWTRVSCVSERASKVKIETCLVDLVAVKYF